MRRRARDERGWFRSIYSVVFEDPDYLRLSRDARLVYLTLRLGPLTNPAGIFRSSLELVQEYTGLPRGGIERALRELETRPTRATSWIVRDRKLLWVRDALRDDPSRPLRGERNHQRQALLGAVRSLPASRVVTEYLAYYPEVRVLLEGLVEGLGKGLPSPSGNSYSHSYSHSKSYSQSKSHSQSRAGNLTSPVPTSEVAHATGSNDGKLTNDQLDALAAASGKTREELVAEIAARREAQHGGRG